MEILNQFLPQGQAGGFFFHDQVSETCWLACTLPFWRYISSPLWTSDVRGGLAESVRAEEGESSTVEESGTECRAAKRDELHIVPGGGEVESEA